MAQPSRMADYVQTKNRTEEQNGGQQSKAELYEDLRVGMPGLKRPSTPGDGRQKKRGHDRGVNRSNSNTIVHAEKDNFGANPASIDENAGGTKIRHDHANNGQQRLSAHPHQLQAGYNNVNSLDDSDEGSQEQAIQNAEALHAGGRPRSPAGTVTDQQPGQVGGQKLAYVKGDSFPPTTDGEPSVSDCAENQGRGSAHIQALDKYAAATPVAKPIPTRGAGTRMPPGRQNAAIHGSHMPSESILPQMLHGQAEQRQLTSQPMNVSHGNPAAGFAFGKPLQIKAMMGRQQPASILPANAIPTVPGQHDQVQVLQRDSVAPPVYPAFLDRNHQMYDKNSGNLAPEPQQQKLAIDKLQTQNSKAQPIEETSSYMLQTSPQRSLYQRPLVPSHLDYNEHHQRSDQDQLAHFSEHEGVMGDFNLDRPPHFEEDLVNNDCVQDFEGRELYSKTFEDLQNACYDQDPSAPEIQLPDFEETEGLPPKLHNVFSSQDARLQARFIRSLAIEEWEEAGDWFLDQFGDLMKQLREARQRKREIAKAFEEEIKQRHEAVAKKRKLTDDALDEMKESGGRVLHVTPGKARQSK